MYFIFGNYGDNTIAVMQWAYVNQLSHVSVIHVDTGLGASIWTHRIMQGQQLAREYGFNTQVIKPSLPFQELVRDRKNFPNSKYQWCTTFLKALPFISFLDEVDASCESVVLFGSRREDSRARQQLTEFIEESEHYGDRKIWYPLYNSTRAERDDLIIAAGFEVLNHRSLECNPCIHSSLSELQHIESKNKTLINILEKEIGQTMFQAKYPNAPLEKLIFNAQQGDDTPSAQLESFDMGCGSRYACGE